MENLQENKNPSIEGTEENAASLNYVHAFKKPTTIGGTEYKTLTFYFERLTGEDVEAVELERFCDALEAHEQAEQAMGDMTP